MSNKFRYYLRKTKALPPEIVIKKAFRKITDKGLNTVSKVSANIFGTKMNEVEFLRRVWNSKYQFNNLEELQSIFCERKEPRFFADSL